MSAFFFLSSNLIWGQGNDLVLLPGTEKLSYNADKGAQKLVGNVNFLYQGNRMFCDSAYYYDKKNLIVAYGKIHVNKADSINLYCDSIRYNGNTKIARLYGNVRVIDRQYRLTTDSLTYDAKRTLASYFTGGKLENTLGSDVLTSKVGHFNPKTKDMTFGGDVHFKNDSLTISSDTLKYKYLQNNAFFYSNTKIQNKDGVIYTNKGWYNTLTEEAQLEDRVRIERESSLLKADYVYQKPQLQYYLAKKNVDYTDSSNKMGFVSDYAYFSKLKGFGFITDRAIAKYYTKGDTVHIHADTIFGYMDSLQAFDRVRATRNARIFSQQFQGIADTLLYSKKSDLLELRSQPILWNRNAELKGEKMFVYLKDSVIDYVEIINQASAVMELDSGAYYNQIGGRKMIARFADNELVRSDVLGNAQSIYYPEETKENDSIVEIKRTGMMRLYASEIRVYLDSGEVTGVTYFEEPDGKFYPMNQIEKDEQFVKGFFFNPMLRPKSVSDLLNMPSRNTAVLAD